VLTEIELQTELSRVKTYVPIGSNWRHRRGEEYFIVGHCVLAGYRIPAILCRGADSILWCRPASQFLDGRFVRVDQLAPVADGMGISAVFGQGGGDLTGIPDSHAGE
jgi:hypothetical protein